MSIETLTAREREVLTLIGKGKSAKEIARDTKTSLGTVGDHTKAVFRKLNVRSRVVAAVMACKAGLV